MTFDFCCCLLTLTRRKFQSSGDHFSSEGISQCHISGNIMLEILAVVSLAGLLFKKWLRQWKRLKRISCSSVFVCSSTLKTQVMDLQENQRLRWVTANKNAVEKAAMPSCALRTAAGRGRNRIAAWHGFGRGKDEYAARTVKSILSFLAVFPMSASLISNVRVVRQLKKP